MKINIKEKVGVDNSNWSSATSKVQEISVAGDTGCLTPIKTWSFGSKEDGVIESVCSIKESDLIEIGFYFGSEKPKSIIKISSQIGCPMKCNFCDVGDIAFERNLTANEMLDQFIFMRSLAFATEDLSKDKKLKINVAGTGDPLLNGHLTDGLKKIAAYNTSMKISTIFPRTKFAFKNFAKLAEFAGNYEDTVQIQISLISTDQKERNKTSGSSLISLNEIAEVGHLWRQNNPVRKQINLSLIINEQSTISAKSVLSILPPEHFRFRFRSYIPTQLGANNSITEVSEIKMQKIKKDFSQAGYYVGQEATPTPTEQAFSLASNVSRRRAKNTDNE